MSGAGTGVTQSPWRAVPGNPDFLGPGHRLAHRIPQSADIREVFFLNSGGQTKNGHLSRRVLPWPTFPVEVNAIKPQAGWACGAGETIILTCSGDTSTNYLQVPCRDRLDVDIQPVGRPSSPEDVAASLYVILRREELQRGEIATMGTSGRGTGSDQPVPPRHRLTRLPSSRALAGRRLLRGGLLRGRS